MPKKHEIMRGLKMNIDKNQVFLISNYEQFLKTMYGKRFPKQFLGIINDFLDVGELQTLDDMKKVIRYYEWKIEALEKRMQRVLQYTARLEEQLQKTDMELKDLQSIPPDKPQVARTVEVARARAIPADTVPEGEIETVTAEAIDERVPLGSQFLEAEIGAEDAEISPRIKEIEKKIKKVKSLEALSSDEEIEKIFR
jgi:hypothetical protein